MGKREFFLMQLKAEKLKVEIWPQHPASDPQNSQKVARLNGFFGLQSQSVRPNNMVSLPPSCW